MTYSSDFLIILLASLIGFAYLLKVRSFDIYEKEPIFKLILVSLFGGVLSVIISLTLYEFVDVELNFIDAIIKIGLIEELSKLFALMILYRFIKKDFNEIVDGIIYMTAVALGFSVIENIMYSFSYEDPFNLLIRRSFFATLGHISFSGYLGLAYYIHKRVHKNYLGIFLSIVIAALAHGFYDGVLFHEELNFSFQMVFLGVVYLQFVLLRTTLGFSKFKKDFDLDLFETSDELQNYRCAYCDEEFNAPVLKFWKTEGANCSICNRFVFTSNNMAQAMRYFRPLVNPNRFIRKYYKLNRIVDLEEDYSILYDTKNRMLSAKPTEYKIWFNEKNEQDRMRVLSWPVVGMMFKYLGLRYRTY
jgi:RsiW-degrading membrane proteinase PrsW (M82 family)